MTQLTQKEIVLKRLKELGNYVDIELQLLIKEEVLTESDYLKLKNEAHQYGEAVLKALARTDYPPQFQEQLVDQLIKQLEIDIKSILSKAHMRKYSESQVSKKLRSIEYDIANDLGLLYEKIEREMTNIRNQYLRESILILKKSKNPEEDFNQLYLKYSNAVKTISRSLINIITQENTKQSDSPKSQTTNPSSPNEDGKDTLQIKSNAEKSTSKKNQLLDWTSRLFRPRKE